MKYSMLIAVAALSLSAAAAAATPEMDAETPELVPDVSTGARTGVRTTQAFDQALIDSWPEKPRTAAKALIDKYGPPDASSDRMLVWHDNGPWKRTIVHREEIEHQFPARHSDFLEQTVAYKVPVDRVGDLARFDGSVIVDRTRGELTSRCDMEEHNRLALNLADEIARGERSVSDARGILARTVETTMAGKSSDYTESLRFTPGAESKTGDPDMSVKSR